jgi:hypothetical protein
MRKLFLPFIVIAAIISSACITPNTPPPTLSPTAQLSYHSHQVQKVLDLIRDTAVDANAQKTTDGKQLLSDARTRQIVQLHETAITLIHANTQGWEQTVYASLTELNKELLPSETSVLGNYMKLGMNMLKGFLP